MVTRHIVGDSFRLAIKTFMWSRARGTDLVRLHPLFRNFDRSSVLEADGKGSSLDDTLSVLGPPPSLKRTCLKKSFRPASCVRHGPRTAVPRSLMWRKLIDFYFREAVDVPLSFKLKNGESQFFTCRVTYEIVENGEKVTKIQVDTPIFFVQISSNYT